MQAPIRFGGFISEKGKDAKDYWTSRRDGDFRNTIINSDGTDYTWSLKNEAYPDNKLTVSQPQPVVVPTDVFAPEPAEWEKAWVNHFFREKPLDQCEFRRRRLFAYTLQIFPVMFFNMLLRTVLFTLVLLTGGRGLSLDYLLYPLNTDLADGFDMWDGGSIFIRSVPEDGISGWEPNPLEFFSYVIRKFCLIPLMPPVLVGVFLLWHFHAVVPALVIFAVLCIFALAATIATFFISGTHKTFWNWLDSLIHYESGYLWYLNQDEMDLLTCKADQKPLDFKTLPARKKTLYLRYQDIKAKICKPFSA